MKEDEAAKKKFEKAKLLFEQGLIANFEELFDLIPYSVVAKKINTNNVRMKAKLSDPMTLKLIELEGIANVLNIDAVALFAFVQASEKAKKSDSTA